MEKKERKVEDLDVEGLVQILEKWEMSEFVKFARDRQIDGLKLSEVTEGLVKLWQPKINAKKFIEFIEDLKCNPDKYMENKTQNKIVEAQYQTVQVKKIREQINVTTGVEDILKKIVAPKSFLYRNQAAKSEKPVTSYTPMEGTPKKVKKFFRMSSYEYPIISTKHFRFSRHENFNDRGYYSIKNNKSNIQSTHKKHEQRKYRSLSTTEELEIYPEDHFYEDLNYNDVDKNSNDIKELKYPNSAVKPCMVKIQELFNSIKLPFFKKSEDPEVERTLETTKTSGSQKEQIEGPIYENSDSMNSMYDSIHVPQETEEKQANLPVEDYLEPVQVTKDYCDVGAKQRDDSILGYIMGIFDTFSMRREATDVIPDELNPENKEEKCLENPQKQRGPMSDRPLPVPVENEPYFMNIDRNEAENLLKGHPDGTFVLRPSSQPNHAYTLTVSCSNAVHNIGIRRRPDGRLALGFARKGERSFTSVTCLIRHHKKRRLLLVAGGDVCGATTLNGTPEYYQTPSSLPLAR